jgi:hypothetical protein
VLIFMTMATWMHFFKPDEIIIRMWQSDSQDQIQCLNGGFRIQINNTCECLPQYGGEHCEFQRLSQSVAILYHAIFYPLGGAFLYLGHYKTAFVQAMFFFAMILLGMAHSMRKITIDRNGTVIRHCNECVEFSYYLVAWCVITFYVFGFFYFTCFHSLKDSNGFSLLA